MHRQQYLRCYTPRYGDKTHIRRRMRGGSCARPRRRAVGAFGSTRATTGTEAVYGSTGRPAPRESERPCPASTRVGGGRDRATSQAASAGGFEDLRVVRLGRGVGAGDPQAREVGGPV